MSGPTPNTRRRVVAAFDFDGTLSTRDNVVPFLRRVGGTAGATFAFGSGAARLLASGRADWTRDALKAELVRRLLAGRDAAEIDALSASFATGVIARHLRAEAVQRADWHRAQGHELVIVSASFGPYLRPVAEHLRFDDVLATELEVGADGRLTGRLLGANARGAEKVRRLDAWLGDDPAFVWAYGDSTGDRALWARADRAVRLGRRARRGTD